MKLTPSPREREALSFIALCNEVLGHSPTHREIARRLGINSRQFVSDMMKNLERKGLIKIQPYKVRGIEVIKQELRSAA